MTPDEFRERYPEGSLATHDANDRPLIGPMLGPDGQVYAGAPGEPPTIATTMAEVYEAQGSRMPTPGLDDLTPEKIAREYRGAIYLAEQRLVRAVEQKDVKGGSRAKAALDDLIARAKAEGVEL